MTSHGVLTLILIIVTDWSISIALLVHEAFLTSACHSALRGL